MSIVVVPNSVREHIEAARLHLSAVYLPADGYRPETDADVWEWVSKDDMVDAYDRVRAAIKQLEMVQSRLFNELASKVEDV